MQTNSECLFCKIVAGEVPAHQVWESETHVAFLTIFPNTPGVTVVIPKEHYTSYVFDLPDQVYQELLAAARTVARKLDRALPDVGRTGLIFEGFGVDHVHAKLYPMHGTANMAKWEPIESKQTDFYETYPGFLSSHDAERADDVVLAALAQQIRETE